MPEVQERDRKAVERIEVTDMLHRIRTGDILLAENKAKNQTNAYLVTYLKDGQDRGYALVCMSCGLVLGKYGDGDGAKAILAKDIKGLLHVKKIIPKEQIALFIKRNYNLGLPVKIHDAPEKYELGIEVDL